jgi:hypothetical protein
MEHPHEVDISSRYLDGDAAATLIRDSMGDKMPCYSLNLKQNNLKSAGVQQLCRIISKEWQLKSLHSLDLSNNGIRDAGIDVCCY